MTFTIIMVRLPSFSRSMTINIDSCECLVSVILHGETVTLSWKLFQFNYVIGVPVKVPWMTGTWQFLLNVGWSKPLQHARGGIATLGRPYRTHNFFSVMCELYGAFNTCWRTAPMTTVWVVYNYSPFESQNPLFFSNENETYKSGGNHVNVCLHLVVMHGMYGEKLATDRCFINADRSALIGVNHTLLRKLCTAARQATTAHEWRWSAQSGASIPWSWPAICTWSSLSLTNTPAYARNYVSDNF